MASTATKYFHGETELQHVHGMPNAEFATKFPGVKGLRYDSFTRMRAVRLAREARPCIAQMSTVRLLASKANRRNEKMKYAVIDTEGSGLFKFKDAATGKPVPADDPAQPRLAAIGMILLNPDFTVKENYQALVKPDGWSMQPEATAVNGLTDEFLNAHGVPVATVLDVYAQAISEGFAMVAFNAQHDLKQMRAELRRAGRDDLFMKTRNVCVMRKARGVIPRRDGKNNWPSLDDCRAHLNLTAAGKHTAGADADAAFAVFMHLRAQGVDLTPEVHLANQGGKPKAPKVTRAVGRTAVAADDEIPQ